MCIYNMYICTYIICTYLYIYETMLWEREGSSNNRVNNQWHALCFRQRASFIKCKVPNVYSLVGNICK